MIGLIVINKNLLNFRKNYEVNNYWLMIINNYQAYWWCIDGKFTFIHLLVNIQERWKITMWMGQSFIVGIEWDILDDVLIFFRFMEFKQIYWNLMLT